MSKSNRVTDDTIDIESSGNAVSLDLSGRTIVSMLVEGDGTADYTWDVRKTGGTWKQDVGQSYSGASNYDDVIETGAQEVRLRCTNGTGSAGDSADILLMAGGR